MRNSREIQIRRKNLLKIYGFLYHRISFVDWGVCLYCGENSQVFDHVPSVSLLESMNIKLYKEGGGEFLLIPCCISCNSILSGNIEVDINARKEIISKRLEKKIKKVAYWTEYEISELGYNLRTLIQNKRTAYEILYSRLINLNIPFLGKYISN